MADVLLVRIESGVAWMTMNRPEVKNAISDELRERLIDAFGVVAGDPAVRAAVLTGAGDAFCPGADLWSGRRDPDAARQPGAARTLMKRNSQRLIRAVLEIEKPVIAAVNGMAAGMGAHLALACDLVVMAAQAPLICFEEEAFAQTLVAQSEDRREGMRAFAERQKPVFQGR